MLHALVPPRPDIDAIKATRAQMTLMRMRPQFMGRSKADTVALCTRIADPADKLWSDDAIVHAEGLQFHDAWRAKRAAGN